MVGEKGGRWELEPGTPTGNIFTLNPPPPPPQGHHKDRSSHLPLLNISAALKAVYIRGNLACSPFPHYHSSMLQCFSGNPRGNNSGKESRNLIKSCINEQFVSLGARMRLGQMRMEALSWGTSSTKGSAQDSHASLSPVHTVFFQVSWACCWVGESSSQALATWVQFFVPTKTFGLSWSTAEGVDSYRTPKP